MKKVLITGASGFIASHLIPALEKKGYEVIKFSREDGRQLINKDDFDDLDPVKLVFHLGAVSGYHDSNQNTSKAYQVNVIGTVNVLEYCKRVKAKLIFPSTYVYDQPYTDYKNEQDKVRPTTNYAFTKLLGEKVCQFYSRVFKVNTLIARTCNVYGVIQDEKYIVPIISQHLLDHQPLTLTKPNIERTYIHVQDVVTAYIKLAEADTQPGDVYNVANPKATGLSQLVKLIEKTATVKGQISYTGQSRPHDVEINRFDIKKLQQKLNWNPKISLEKGIQTYLANLKKK